MVKKLADFTSRERIIGVAAIIFAVISIGGISNAIGDSSTPAPVVAPAPTAEVPAAEFKSTQETEVVPFAKETKNDSTRNAGTSAVTIVGVNGVRTKIYKITMVNGVETGRELMSDVITTPAVNEVTSVGAYVAPAKKASSNCDPNYSGACVPIASDVDCAGGSGNGPAYVRGPVNVIGSDIYDLDRDGDGVGCE